MGGARGFENLTCAKFDNLTGGAEVRQNLTPYPGHKGAMSMVVMVREKNRWERELCRLIDADGERFFLLFEKVSS